MVTLPALTARPHKIKAQYSGDTIFSDSSGFVGFNVLALFGPTVNVSVSPGSPSTTDRVTATATVTVGATGTAQFMLDGMAAGTPVNIASATAQTLLGTLAAGNNRVAVQ